jgi:hypothetical protein
MTMAQKIGPITFGCAEGEPQHFDSLEVVAAPPGRIRFSFLRHTPAGTCELIFLEVSEDVWRAMVDGGHLLLPARKPGGRIAHGKGGGMSSDFLHRDLLRRAEMR